MSFLRYVTGPRSQVYHLKNSIKLKKLRFIEINYFNKYKAMNDSKRFWHDYIA